MFLAAFEYVSTTFPASSTTLTLEGIEHARNNGTGMDSSIPNTNKTPESFHCLRISRGAYNNHSIKECCPAARPSTFRL